MTQQIASVLGGSSYSGFLHPCPPHPPSWLLLPLLSLFNIILHQSPFVRHMKLSASPIGTITPIPSLSAVRGFSDTEHTRLQSVSTGTGTGFAIPRPTGGLNKGPV